MLFVGLICLWILIFDRRCWRAFACEDKTPPEAAAKQNTTGQENKKAPLFSAPTQALNEPPVRIAFECLVEWSQNNVARKTLCPELKGIVRWEDHVGFPFPLFVDSAPKVCRGSNRLTDDRNVGVCIDWIHVDFEKH
jgi:hypothetical protein